jgi:RNA-directed DNA polymerase
LSSSRGVRRQQPSPQGTYRRYEAVNPLGTDGEPSAPPARNRAESHEGPGTGLLEQMLTRDNLRSALKRVERKPDAAPGVDGMTVPELRTFLSTPGNWERIRTDILAGTYEPTPVRRVEIPKPGGKGKRLLGIPTMLDRFLQQALMQVLTPLFEPHFSDSSDGFRPGRSQHNSVRRARRYIQEGHDWVVDLDLEKFFDRVNHDILMARVARRVHDQRVLRLIRKYLESGVMIGGVVEATEEGTPQGGPLSPLLSNILLDDLDKELERRGHKFARYADDCNIYVRSRRAGERVMQSVTQFLEGTLKLRVNQEKSAVDRPWRRKFLGFSFFRHKGEVRVRIAPQSLKRVERDIRTLTSRRKSQAMAQRIASLNKRLKGWVDYFALTDTPSVYERLDEWLRRRLRMCLWKQWKRYKTRVRELLALGLKERAAREIAGTRKGYWRTACTPQLHQALGKAYWASQGLISLAQRYQERRGVLRTAGCGSA